MTDMLEQPVVTGGLNVFLPFDRMEKQSDGTIRVFTTLNDETVDDQGEIVDYDGAKAALDEFMKFANVREMHQPSAAGIAESIQHDDVLRKTTGILHIVDAEAVKKVEARVYKGTSLGGWKRDRVPEMSKATGKQVVRIRRPIINEISLVDRPSRATALLQMMKVSDITEPPADADIVLALEEPAAEAPAEEPAADGLEKASGGDAQATTSTTPAVGTPGPAAGDTPEEPLAKAADDPPVDPPVALEPEPVVAAPVLAEEDKAIEMAYAAVIGDLAKRSASQDSTRPVLLGALEAFFKPVPSVEPQQADGPAPIIDTPLETGYNAEEFMKKISAVVVEANGDTQKRVEAMESLVTKMSGDLEKMAKAPASGGPLRYAMDDRRFSDLRGLMDSPGNSRSDEADILAKAARETDDPIAREALGHAAAARQIRELRG